MYGVLGEGLANDVRNVIELRRYTVFPFRMYLCNVFRVSDDAAVLYFYRYDVIRSLLSRIYDSIKQRVHMRLYSFYRLAMIYIIFIL